ncbi:hypothetical protein [Brunnivagina elsteri]|uniref:Uncharacterized protein n=1 Tax=Brunnivagina elsteri CCALA 953 TaxID=987040 RepID=A0A2A2TGY5_9CYAN|nr:hypothetical protein [Calothrix elsteri]PAX52951.1 hypothetical protein CK510_16550 [Calothrix elsteri CCALA 953]
MNSNNKIETSKFWIQVLFSTVVLSLCTFQLVNKDSQASEKAMYWGGLTGVLAYWLPSPSSSRESEQYKRTPQKEMPNVIL